MLKRKFAVIGHPIGHTMSPFINSELFRLCNKEGEYIAIDIAPENIEKTFKEDLRFRKGFNVTIPHKRNIISCLDIIDEKAKLYGSVNTVCNSEEKSIGYTTDPDGFLKSLENENIKLEGNVVVLGNGGVSRIMLFESAFRNCNIVIAHREKSVKEANSLMQEAIEKTGNKNIICSSFENILENVNGDIDVMLNGTPVGMYPNVNGCPVSDKIISRTKNAFDAIYNPKDTVFVQKCLANGTKAYSGMSMLVFQAVKAHEIWDNVSYKKGDIDELIEKANYEMIKKFNH